MEDLDKRLDAATKRRDSLASEHKRLEGKLEAAEAALKAVEEECRAKGINPADIDNVIEKLEAKYEAAVTQVEQNVASAETALAPFLKETVG